MNTDYLLMLLLSSLIFPWLMHKGPMMGEGAERQGTSGLFSSLVLGSLSTAKVDCV
jgi:hypothetical protein